MRRLVACLVWSCLASAPAVAQQADPPAPARGLAPAALPAATAGAIPRPAAEGGPAATVGTLIGALNNTGNTTNTANTVNTSTVNTSTVNTR